MPRFSSLIPEIMLKTLHALGTERSVAFFYHCMSLHLFQDDEQRFHYRQCRLSIVRSILFLACSDGGLDCRRPSSFILFYSILVPGEQVGSG
jgi:hypothetical protein